jgi:hypothetical protein
VILCLPRRQSQPIPAGLGKIGNAGRRKEKRRLTGLAALWVRCLERIPRSDTRSDLDAERHPQVDKLAVCTQHHAANYSRCGRHIAPWQFEHNFVMDLPLQLRL